LNSAGWRYRFDVAGALDEAVSAAATETCPRVATDFPQAVISAGDGVTHRAASAIRRYSRIAVVLWLGLFGYLGRGVLCDVHCEAELADNADFALAAGVVASASVVRAVEAERTNG
jgi:hypothetical protein